MRKSKHDTVDMANRQTAKTAGLTYVSDHEPGITRVRKGKGFHYRSPSGKVVTEPRTVSRIAALAIPPAWDNVWISPRPTGHIQATGRDARGRKQYLYHAQWRQTRDQSKFDRMIALGKRLERLRRRITRDLRRRGLPKEKVVATVVRLLETTFIRVGNEEYARENKSYGLTTLRDRHVDIQGDKVHFEFKGKSGVRHAIDLYDPRIAPIVKRCQELPGQELFQYVDSNGRRHRVKSDDVNAYLHEAMGEEFTAKDFRTWAGTVLAAVALTEFETFDSEAHAKRNIMQAIEKVAKRLGNTKTVCRQCYVHPAVFDAYLDGSFRSVIQLKVEKELTHSLNTLSSEETAVLAFLQQHLKRTASTSASAG